MNCSKCGRTLPDDSLFCTACGAKIEVVSGDIGKPVYVIDGGVNKILYVYSDRCVIRGQHKIKAMTPMSFAGDKEFYYCDMTSVQYRPATTMVRGLIEFEFPGSHSANGIGNSENGMLLGKFQGDLSQIDNAIAYIKTKIKEFKNKPLQATTIQQQISPAEELLKFKQLLDAGIITQDEFDNKKKQLLG